MFPWISGSGNLTISVAKTFTTIDLYDTGYALNKDQVNTVNCKIYGGNIYFDINGNTNNTALLNPIRYNTFGVTETLLGAISNAAGVNQDNPFYGNCHHLKVYELDASGNQIKDLIITDFNNGDINTVPNIGTDKPASSDMLWVPSGSGTYIDI